MVHIFSDKYLQIFPVLLNPVSSLMENWLKRNLKVLKLAIMVLIKTRFSMVLPKI